MLRVAPQSRTTLWRRRRKLNFGQRVLQRVVGAQNYVRSFLEHSSSDVVTSRESSHLTGVGNHGTNNQHHEDDVVTRNEQDGYQSFVDIPDTVYDNGDPVQDGEQDTSSHDDSSNGIQSPLSGIQVLADDSLSEDEGPQQSSHRDSDEPNPLHLLSGHGNNSHNSTDGSLFLSASSSNSETNSSSSSEESDPDSDPEYPDGSDNDHEDYEEVEDDSPFFNVESVMLDRGLIARRHLTRRDAVVLTVAQAVRYNWSYLAIEDNLKAWNAFLGASVPNRGGLHTSKYFLWKYIGRDKNALCFHVYCKSCFVYICERQEHLHEYQCPLCHEVQTRFQVRTFITFSIRRQLARLLKSDRFRELLRYRENRHAPTDGSMADLMDGRAYKTHRQPGGLLASNLHFSYIVNTDGFPVFNTSSVQAWCLYATICEIPPAERKKYVLLAGVWVDTVEPNMNTFMLPLVKDMNSLSSHGVSVSVNGYIMQYKFFVLILTLDSAARYKVLNMNSWNGAYACVTCVENGTTVDESTGQQHRHRKYPVRREYPLRTHAQVKRAMMAAARHGIDVLGFKGLSIIICILLSMDIPISVVVDVLHCIYLGIVKKHTKHMLSGKNANEPYYIGLDSTKDRIDARFLAIKPPSAIARPPRSIRHVSKWVGAEWRSWILYYCVPCLQGIVPPQYLTHLSLLSHGIFLLSCRTVSEDDVLRAKTLFTQYRERCQQYFGFGYMVFNLHILTHIPFCVLNWGPVWTHSTMDFETLNGTMKKEIKGHTDVAEQIATRFLMKSFLRESVEFENSIPEDIKIYVNEVLGEKRPKRVVHVGCSSFHCSGQLSTPNLQERHALTLMGYTTETVTRYNKVKIRRYTYGRYRNHHKTDNSVLYCNDGEIALFKSAVTFLHNGISVAGIFVKLCTQLNRLAHANHTVEFVSNGDFVFVTDYQVQCPAVVVRIGPRNFSSPLPNDIEQH